jgi:hypothetical protein
MIALLSLLLVFALSLLMVRIGTVALVMTGISEEVARFQALSAFSGAGFTTGEAENVISSPARRRIIALLIRAGSLGIITAISSLVLSFAGAEERVPATWKLMMLLAGVIALLLLARSQTMNRILTPLISRGLQRYTTLDLRDYAALLHLREDYRVVEVEAEPDSWLTKAPIGDLALEKEGVAVLGIVRRNREYIGTPEADQRIMEGDKIILYGRAGRIDELRTRPRTNYAAHVQAEQEQKEVQKEVQKEAQKAQPD